MSDFRFLNSWKLDQMTDKEFIGLAEIAFQLKRIADLMEDKQNEQIK